MKSFERFKIPHLTIVSCALLFCLQQTAMAQSNATGNIFGKIDTTSEEATISIVNVNSGLKKTIPVDSTGRYRITALPTGHYKVELLRKNAVVATTEVDVVIGQGVEASFNKKSAETLQVSAKRKRLDTSTTTNGATFTQTELQKLPIKQSVEAIVQLAPNTTNADPRYPGGASFGGGGASENAYYINGFPVTNALSQLGASELPFGAIEQAQVLTGGYGAEFGRSVGGVVNITTKSGTNEWQTGAIVSYDIPKLEAKRKNTYYANTGVNPLTDGTIYMSRDQTKTTLQKIGAYVSGPIIENKVFMFAAIDDTRATFSGVNLNKPANDTANGKTGWKESKDETLRYMGKLDWNITDDHRLEFTQIGDTSTTDSKLSGYDYATKEHNKEVYSSEHYTNMADKTPAVGADVSILKYTGNFTEDLTTTFLVGQSKTKRLNTYDGYNINEELYQVTAATDNRAPGITYTNPQPLSGNITPPGAYDRVKSLRFDLEYKLSDHTLRAGLDENRLSSHNAGEFVAGGGRWIYSKTKTPNTPIDLTGQKVIVANGGGLGTEGYYVRKAFFSSATEAYSNQSAQYIEDRFQATDDLLVTLGVRNEQFANLNGDKVTFLKMDNQIAPRLGASWDVFGDSTTKVFGSAGRYHLQMPTRLAVRAASRSTNTSEYFTYTGVDAKGVPTGLVPLTGVLSTNGEFGQAKDTNVVAAQGLKPIFQDELTLGFEQVLTPTWNFGLKGTYRTLRSTIDDFCGGAIVKDWAGRNGISTTNWTKEDFGCRYFNPGEANDFLVDFDKTGNYTKVHLTKADLGFEKAERIYKALDLFLEHQLESNWYGKVNYTWSSSKGNTEGQTLSDIGQTDVAATQSWDIPQLMENAKGRLPNDRTHQLKAYGFYDLTSDWTLGGNFVYETGRPRSCLGNYPGGGIGYNSNFHYCDGVPAPRGKAGELPYSMRVDSNVEHRPEWIPGLGIRLDIFNLFNKQVAQAVDEVSNKADGTIVSTYGRVIRYSDPRSARITAEYSKKF